MTIEFDDLLGVFIDEATEYVDVMDVALVDLEKNPQDAELLGLLMRTAHNLKGTSGTVGVGTIAEAMHSLESVLRGFESGVLVGSTETFALLFGLIDGLRDGLENLQSSERDLSVLAGQIPGLTALLDAVEDRGDGVGGPDVESDLLSRFALGEFDCVRVDVCLNRGQKLYVVSVQPSFVASDAVDWISWNREVHKALRQHGDVIATHPASVELERIGELGRMHVMLASRQTSEQLRRDLVFTHNAALEALDGPCEWILETELCSDTAQFSEEGSAVAMAEKPDETTDRPMNAASARSQETVRVNLERIDSLVELIGELVVVESMVTAAPELGSIQSPRLRAYLGQLTKITRELQEVGMQMRMVSVGGLFKRMRRIVRDVANDEQKEIRFVATGESSEIDRSMVEQLSDPLVHLIRNAVDHGIESVEARRRLGKSDEGQIRLSALHQGGKLVIQVSDDGAGLDREAIVARAMAEGLISDASGMSDAEVFNLIFTEGFSTAREVTSVSGRGVGMNVVRRDVEALQGRVLVSSTRGRGTTFELVLPLTLAIIDGMLVQSGAERYIIPTLSILESIQPNASMLYTFLGGHQVIKLRDETIPLAFLGRIFQVDGAEENPCRGLVVVVEAGAGKLGIVVDHVLVQQQIVIKNVGYGMGDTRYLSGAAILSDGAVGLIVNVDEVAKLSRTKEGGTASGAGGRNPKSSAQRHDGSSAEGE